LRRREEPKEKPMSSKVPDNWHLRRRFQNKPKGKLKDRGLVWQAPKPGETGEKSKKCILNGLLNKLSDDNIDRLLKDIVKNTRENEEECIKLILKKALEEPTFCHLYARLCNGIYIGLRTETDDESAAKTEAEVAAKAKAEAEAAALASEFMTILLRQCNEIFKKHEKWSHVSREKDMHYKLKERSLGIVQFIGHLYLNDLVDNIFIYINELFDCVNRDLKSEPVSTDSCMVLLKILEVVGESIDDTDTEIVTGYFKKLVCFQDMPNLKKRIKFVIQDVIDLRKSDWGSRD
jgi:translation initiation factor 4G